MNKFEKIEQLRKSWKADMAEAKSKQYANIAERISFKLFGLESAMEIFERSSNTSMQIDTKPCSVDHKSFQNFWSCKFCPECGEALRD